MFKNNKKEEVAEETVPEKLYLGTAVTTDIESRLINGTWETTGKIHLRRSLDLETWEEYTDSVKSISKDYGNALLTVLQALNAIINEANSNENLFAKRLNEPESPSQ